MKKLICTLMVLSLTLLMAATCLAEDGEVIGSVRTVSGQAEVLRGEEVIPADLSVRLYQGDTLRTGKKGSMGIILRDDTTLSLGPDSILVLDEFIFDPDASDLGMSTKLMKGTAAVVTGTIGKLAPEKVTMETPTATIGIRGTKYVVKVED